MRCPALTPGMRPPGGRMGPRGYNGGDGRNGGRGAFPYAPATQSPYGSCECAWRVWYSSVRGEVTRHGGRWEGPERYNCATRPALSGYARSMGCPVLTQRMTGADTAYGRYWHSVWPVRAQRMTGAAAYGRYWHSVLTQRCRVLTERMAIPGGGRERGAEAHSCQECQVCGGGRRRRRRREGGSGRSEAGE
eukprot:3500852-Rhodomonas_salina.3